MAAVVNRLDHATLRPARGARGALDAALRTQVVLVDLGDQPRGPCAISAYSPSTWTRMRRAVAANPNSSHDNGLRAPIEPGDSACMIFGSDGRKIMIIRLRVLASISGRRTRSRRRRARRTSTGSPARASGIGIW